MKKVCRAVPDSLEEILKMCFGCKKPFLKKKQIDYIESDGEKHFRFLTVAGSKAYGDLVDVVYGLEMIGVISDANEIVEQLDDIVSSEQY